MRIFPFITGVSDRVTGPVRAHSSSTLSESGSSINLPSSMRASGLPSKDEKLPCYSIGQLIHNKDVVKRLESMGVTMIGSLDEAGEGDTVIVRSHGEPKEFYDKAAERGIELIDTTCVFVKKIHDIVSKAHEDGIPVVLIGDREHQEVKATNGWCGYSAHLIGNAAEAENEVNDLKGSEPIIVCQTTIKEELLREVLEVFDRAGISYDIRNTICNATRERQESCAELCRTGVSGRRNGSYR